jgi:hypothetical protein
MLSKRALVPNPPHRLPRKGLLFLLIRFVGLLLKIAGLLLFCIAMISFFFMLVQIGPTIVESLRYIDQQKIAGLIFITSLVSLSIFPVIGSVGAAMAMLGFALGYIGTEPATSMSITSPDQGQGSQLMEEPKKDAG